jgi:hypothetical protein
MPNFTYGDAVRSPTDKYVIAQFRADAELEWVSRLRSFFQVAELKYRDFVPERRSHLQSKPELWGSFTKGIRQAEITIIDPKEYENYHIWELLDQQAVPGHDFDYKTIREMAGRTMIEWSPIGRIGAFSMDWLVNQEEIKDVTADGLHRRAGGKRHDAIVLAGRSHAMLSPSEVSELISLAMGPISFPRSNRMNDIERMARIFDDEHKPSLPLLNDLVDQVGYLVGGTSYALGPKQVLVKEMPSREADHLQAADMAAGWAVDVLTFTNGDYRHLAQQFAWVGVNGVVIPDTT